MSEFYVGYLDRAPPKLGVFVRGVVLGLLCAVPLCTGGLSAAQRGYAAAVFEYGVPHTVEGVYVAWPAPALLVARPGKTEGQSSSMVLLVGQGKFGVNDTFDGLDLHTVRVEGSLIYRNDETMLEVSGRPEDLGQSRVSLRALEAGEVTLEGEIVDSKCFLGVMNPGNLKPHRDCAVRCLSGGIPPLLLVRQTDGTTRHVLVVGQGGEPIGRELLDRVAEPLRVTGQLSARNNQWILKADPSAFQRVE